MCTTDTLTIICMKMEEGVTTKRMRQEINLHKPIYAEIS